MFRSALTADEATEAALLKVDARPAKEGVGCRKNYFESLGNHFQVRD